MRLVRNIFGRLAGTQANIGADQRPRSCTHREMESGAQGRNRTTDTAIFNRMLYQLSYLGAKLALNGPIGEARAL